MDDVDLEFRRLSAGGPGGASATPGERFGPTWAFALRVEQAISRGLSETQDDAFAHFLDGGVDPAQARLGEALGRWLLLHRPLLPRNEWAQRMQDLASLDERAAAAAALALRWQRWGQGLPVPLDQHSEATLRPEVAPLRIEAALLRALVLGSLSGNSADAVAQARRASRMARSEELPHFEILASLVLARCRRLENRAYLAVHILRALEPHVPNSWWSWGRWELEMAGARVSQRSDAEPSSALGSLRAAVALGDRGKAERACAELEATVLMAPFREDARLAEALLLGSEPRPTPERISRIQNTDSGTHEHRAVSSFTLTDAAHRVGDDQRDVPGAANQQSVFLRRALVAWRRGATNALPTGLNGLAFGEPMRGAVPECAWVVAGPGADSCEASRWPRASLALVHGMTQVPDSVQPRVDAGLAMLALSGGAIPAADYFAALYGFDYEPGPHGAMFGMHRKRLRERLGESGDILLDGQTLRLRLRRRVLLPDPRCEQGLEERILRLASELGELSARAVAQALALPLRSAQRGLAALVEDGVIDAVGAGPRRRYVVEDTTFSEPTRSRFLALLSTET